MTEMIRLELRKQKMAFLALAAGILVSLPCAWVGGRLGGVSSHRVLTAFLYFWAWAGLPIAASLLSASAGAGLRAEPSVSAEAALPVSDRQKFAAGWLAAAGYLVFCALLVWSGVFAESILRTGWGGSLDKEITLVLFMTIPCLLYISLGSFVCSYVLGKGVVGGIMGSMLGAALGGAAAVGCLPLVAQDSSLRFRSSTAFLILLCMAGVVYVLAEAPACAQSSGRQAWAKAAILFGGGALGPAVLLAAIAKWLMVAFFGDY
ncbi:MAG: hypothetical protein HY926_02100 [Elusimicrobia bacterium]|nr:hypothetical protein [Elusimicrobiota bacterium]